MGRTSEAKQRLIESAGALMHERGYTAVGVNELCQAADVKKGSFYYFFRSKVDLAVAVIEEVFQASSESMEELAHGTASPLARLAAYARRVTEAQTALHANCGKVLGCPIGNLGLEMSTQEPELRERLRGVFERDLECFEAALGEAIERGDLAPLDTRRAACSILALLEGSVMLAKMANDPEVLRGLEGDLMRLIGADARRAA